ncbi:MAG TPA: hypothetical protein EYH35_01010 [Thiotrichaceae bacterium]|nr:hypothetical protein [Thiotrichaceae bacterium]
MPPLTRIEIAEIIRPFSEMSLENLKKHLEVSSFPLPLRSKKIFNLNQSLLLEMAGAYQLSALDMLTKGEKNKKLLLLPIGRSMNYMGRVLINTYGLYIKPRKALWRDIHHLYLIACENNIQHLTIPEKSSVDYACSTIEFYYKHISLLALALPHSIRVGEVFRLNRFFHKIIDYIDIYSDSSSTQGKYAHIAMLNSDEPPTLMPVAELLNSPTVRLFDLSKVLKILSVFCKETDNTPLGTNDTFPMLNHSLAERLISSLTTVQNRRFKRFPRNEKTPVVSHLRNIVEVLKSEQQDNNIEDSADDLFHELTFGDLNASTWVNNEPVENKHPNVKLRAWEIQNSCSEGYGLLWKNEDPSGVRVGELIAVQDPEDDSHKWQIGTIRWMEFAQHKGLAVGIELLSPSALPLSINNVTNRTISQKLPINGLLLPIIEGLKEKPYLILPDYIFNIGDIIEVQIGNNTENLEIINLDESYGAFSVCEYISSVKEEIHEVSDDYNDIWEAL